MFNEYGRYLYGYPRQYRNQTVIDEEIISLNVAIDKIRDLIKKNQNLEEYFENLILVTPEEQKEIIISMRDDEKKHDEILRFIYSNLTGDTITMEQIKQNEENEELNYKNELEQNFMDKVDLIAKHRKIMAAMPNTKMHNLIMAILTDEIRHASLYNYLIHKSHS